MKISVSRNVTGLKFIAPVSFRDGRDYGICPNNSRNLNGTLIYDVPAHPSHSNPVDSRANKLVQSFDHLPQNSRQRLG